MCVVFAVFLLPLIAAILVLMVFLDLCSRVFVLLAPQIFLAVLIAYFHLRKKGIFRKYDSKKLNAAAISLKVLMIIYMIFNLLVFLFCLIYLIMI